MKSTMRSSLVAMAPLVLLGSLVGQAPPNPSAHLVKPTPAMSAVTLQFIDQSRAQIPGVQVTLTRPPDQLETGRDGRLTLDLKPGEYTVHAAMPGFSSLDRSFQAGASDKQAIDFVLRVAPSGSGFPVASEPQLQIILPPNDKQFVSASDLHTFPQKTVKFRNSHTNTEETYSGVPLTELLAKYGAPTGKDLHGKPLSDYLVATGSDGYKAVLSLAETDPSFHPGDVIVADSMDGKPLDAANGPFKLVVTEDKRPARCVHNLVSIELRTAE